MKQLRISLVFLLCLTTLLGVTRSTALASGIITTTATKTTVDGLERFTVSVNIDQTTNFMGIQFSLDFDTALLEAVKISAGDVWPVGGTFVAVNNVDNTTGVVEFAASITSNAQTVSGSVATIIFEAKNPSTTSTTDITQGTSLALTIAGNLGVSIPATGPDLLTITINPAPTIDGTTSLQAAGSGATARDVIVNVTNLLYQSNTQFAAGSTFSIAIPTAGNYTLSATATCHVSASKSSVAAPSAGHTATLLAGDVNGDDLVNIQDLSAIGSLFGQTGITTCANMNADAAGTVNILDLSLTASNYGKVGPITWP